MGAEEAQSGGVVGVEKGVDPAHGGGQASEEMVQEGRGGG